MKLIGKSGWPRGFEKLPVEFGYSSTAARKIHTLFKGLAMWEDNIGSDELGRLLARSQAGDPVALGQLLSRIERDGASVLASQELREPGRIAFRIGITGPPGAGKSTLTNGLIRAFRRQQKRIAVLAVDPSSPFSGGAILGDRIRYQDHFNDPGVFIRSLGTRGSLGGLSAAAYLMLRAFDACGFDLALVETVGVGQTELEVVSVADQVGVVLVPESGDAIQAMKAGLMEIADFFVVNKSDRPGAEAMVRELEALPGLSPETARKQPKVFKTVATTDIGVEELANFLLQLCDPGLARAHRLSPDRLRAEAKALLRAQWESKIQAETDGIMTGADLWRKLAQDPVGN